MKKGIKLLILSIAVFFISTSVNAASYYFGSPYERTMVGDHYMYEYHTDSNGGGSAYCLSPNKKAPGSVEYSDSINGAGDVDPRTSTYHRALAVAYTEFVNRGYIRENHNTMQIPIIITVRMIASHYKQLDTAGSLGGQAGAYKSPTDIRLVFGASYQWSNEAIDIYNKAISAADSGKSYEELASSGLVWDPSWAFENVNENVDESNSNIVNLEFDVVAKSNTAYPQRTLADKFTIECDYGYKCEMQGTPQDIGGGQFPRVRMKVRVDISGGNATEANANKAKYGIKIKTVFVDSRYSIGRMKILAPVNASGKQKMILIRWEDMPSEKVIPFEQKESCVCKTDINGKYVEPATYVYTDENGKVTEFPIDDPQAKEHSCSGTCENPPHSCETPNESGDGKYYCKESEEGKGDGPACDEDQYNKECMCPVLREECEENPNSPSCQEYDEKCTNCNPTISLPTDCNNFDTESSFTGTVSDINEIATTCNPKVNEVKQCVLGEEDLTGTSFEATNELNGNPYCKVWCKENYQFTVPTAKYSKSGGYFTLVTTINGTRDCYISGSDNPNGPIDNDKFQNDLTDAQKALVESYNSYSYWKGAVDAPVTGYELDGEGREDHSKPIYTWDYTSYTFTDSGVSAQTLKGSITGDKSDAESKRDSALEAVRSGKEKIINIIDTYNNCTEGWSNAMEFNPEVDFWYNEDYIKADSAVGHFTKTKDGEAINNNVYCLGDVNNHYECSNAANEGNLKKDQSFVVCDEGGCSTDTKEVSQAKWIQKSKTRSATYQPNNQFSTYTQYGTIKLNAPECNGNDCLWTRLPDEALPVQLRTGSGVFPFKFTFKNIGQSNSGKDLGRLIGQTSSVIDAYSELSDAEKCSLQENGEDIKASVDGSYVCHYLNNCDDCDFSCEGDNCYFDDCDDGKCDLKCDTCIFDGETQAFKYRTVSLSNLFPNSCEEGVEGCREEGYNWNSSTKAKVTKLEIEDLGEKIFDEPEYSYTLTPSQLQEIRRYNKAVGSYSNTTTDTGEAALKCSNYEANNINYNVKCTSTFLDNEGNKYFTENKRNENWTLWSDDESEYCPGGICLDRNTGIGPSWK